MLFTRWGVSIPILRGAKVAQREKAIYPKEKAMAIGKTKSNPTRLFKRIINSFFGLLVIFAIGASTFGARPASADHNANGSRLNLQIRTDGIYYLIQSDIKNAEGLPLCVAVRFYDDNISIESEFYGTTADFVYLLKWFNRDNENQFLGTWSLNGDSLTVVESTGFQEKSRTGTLTTEGWRINDRIVFAFAQLSFPKEPASLPKNRRPYFKGYGNVVKKFDYDAAGTLVGINNEIEILAADPDGDPLKFTWKASNGSLIGEGPKVVWKRGMQDGQPLPGKISVEVTDGKGGRISSEIDLKKN